MFIKTNRPLLVERLVLLYCAWSSRELLTAWYEAPLEKHVWLLFLLWTLPLIVQWKLPLERKFGTAYSLELIALGMALVGTIGLLNTLCYWGFAFACAALLPLNWASTPWLCSAIVWMPAMGWISAHYVPFPVFPLRLFLVFIGVGLWVVWRWRRDKGK